ncbi:MAG: NUDIX domain-containing protein [Bacteroidales bacterium]|nr:NUDIX domain-containing protein [Bacteroidales bacterium]
MFELFYPPYPAPEVPKPTADAPSTSLVTSGEKLPVIDPTGMVIGQAARRYCHGGAKPLHPVVHLHILNRNGDLYLQKRSMHKDLLPGRWDTAVGGHVDYGESIEEALVREASEELGFYDFNPVYIDTYEFESAVEREMVSIFAAVGNFDLHPDADEVEQGRFWTMDEIEATIGKDILTPNFEGEFRKIRKTLESLL